jgi:hypothetical protein
MQADGERAEVETDDIHGRGAEIRRLQPLERILPWID